MTIVDTTHTGAEDVRWDLSDLYASSNAPEIEADVETINTRLTAFDQTYRSKVAGLSAQEMLVALQEYEAIQEMVARIVVFAQLAWTTDTINPESGKFLAKAQKQQVEFAQRLMFFQLEWRAAPEETAKLADDPVLKKYEHYLKVTRLLAPYTLSEKEEHVITELSLSGVTGWNRYFTEVMSRAKYELDGQSLNQGQILKYLYSADRDQRQRAADAFTRGLHDLSHTSTYVFNMLAAHKRSLDKMRGYPSWVASRNLSNELDDADVEALVGAVTSRYDIVQRYYRLHKKLLGHDQLYDYDRYAPVMDEEWHVHWDEAREMVMESFEKFDPRVATIATKFFEGHWIDAALAPNKRSGAFSAGTVPSAHPYILMNYTGTLRDVMTLAHELGHGVHQYVSRQQGYLQASTPLTTAEMASTFCEMLVFDSVMAELDDPRVRLANRIEKISDTFATVFRQISMNRFEDAMHTACRTEGELSKDRLSELWMQVQRAMFGDSLTLRDEYSIWWSYIPHFLGTPGYVYAYAFGELLVWALYARYQSEGSSFSGKYLEALGKGGSQWPHEILAPLGVNLKDPNFWHEGLSLIENMVIQAEQEAEALNYQV